MTRLTMAETAALARLKERLEQIPGFVLLKLFGSKARDDSDRESDIDVLVVLENCDRTTRRRVHDLCYDLSVDHSVLIVPVIYTRAEFESELTKGSPFYQVVAREGVAL